MIHTDNTILANSRFTAAVLVLLLMGAPRGTWASDCCWMTGYGSNQHLYCDPNCEPERFRYVDAYEEEEEDSELGWKIFLGIFFAVIFLSVPVLWWRLCCRGQQNGPAAPEEESPTAKPEETALPDPQQEEVAPVAVGAIPTDDAAQVVAVSKAEVSKDYRDIYGTEEMSA
jgi:hypothetical protein